jgi:hypothetical protein
VLLLKYSVHYVSETEQVQIKFGFIVIFMAEAVAHVVDKIICYVAYVDEKRNAYRNLVQKCEGMI